MTTIENPAARAALTLYVLWQTADKFRLLGYALIVFGLMLGATEVLAQTSSQMPWEAPLCKVALSLSGPVARAVAVIAIVVCGLMLAFGEMNGIFKTFLGLLMGIAMALLASQWVGFIDNKGTGFCGQS